jgi:hypothetical protein
MFLIILLLSGCSRNCEREVVEMYMRSITTEQTNEEAIIDGYYYSELQEGTLNIEISFVHQGAGEFCDYSWASYPVDNGLTITAQDSIMLGGDMIEPNEPINDYLDIQNLENNYTLKYLITLKNTTPSPGSGTFQFNGKLELDDGVVLADSCIIKYN